MRLFRIILVSALVTLVVPAKSNALESTQIDTPVIATWAFGRFAAIWSQPVSQAIADEYSLEVCHKADCFVARSYVAIPYTANASVSRKTITAMFDLFGDYRDPSLFYIRNKALPLTATISAGSSPSNPTRSDPSATFYADPPEYSPIDATQQFMQPVLTSLTTSWLSMGLCFNRTSDAFRWDDVQERIGLRFPGYSLMYEISKEGTVIHSGKSSTLGDGEQGAWFNGRYCEDGVEGDERFFINPPGRTQVVPGYKSLDAGTTYTFTYSLVASSSPTVSGALDFTTPGGCPSTPPGPPKHLAKSGWAALLDSSGRYIAMFQGFSPRQSAYMSTAKFANLYLSAYKTWPSNSSFIYVPEIDDFAMDMSTLSTNGKFQIKDATIFKDCSPEQVQVAVSTGGSSRNADATACQIVEGNIIPQRVERCILRVQLTRRASVTASGVRKMGFTFTRDLAVYFSSIPVPASPATIATLPTTIISKAPVARISRITSGKSIASFLKLSVTSKSTIRLRIATSSLKFCKVAGTSIKGLKVGRCKLTISVKPQRGATKSRTITLKVTR